MVPMTLLGITFLVFGITRVVPGGPVHRMLQQLTPSPDQSGPAAKSGANTSGIDDGQLEELEEQYGLNLPMYVAYGQWLGIFPKESMHSKAEFGAGDDLLNQVANPNDYANVTLRGEGIKVVVQRRGDQILTIGVDGLKKEWVRGDWEVRYESEAVRQAASMKRNPGVTNSPKKPARVVIYKTNYRGLLQGDFGRSTVYNDSVLDMMLSRVPIALYFGLWTAVITYGVCLPLGVIKALKHRTWMDSGSSILIFIGYSIPGFALGAIMVIYLGARLNWFPLFGLVSPGAAQMNVLEQLIDLLHHSVLPMICYVVGSFAVLTMLTKNSLMDHLAADYMKTAVSKGSSYRRAVFFHAFRNAMIPVATSLGDLITIFVGGSMLVETVFDIQGFGLLQYQSVMARDVPVMMGTLTVAAFLMLLGHVISDLIVAIVDPRIKFE